jgi:curved DNA-binding protein CbpA
MEIEYQPETPTFPYRYGSEANFYSILGVSNNASQNEIRDAYLRQKNALSSGSQALYSLLDEDSLADTLRSIEQAFAVLSDPRERATYNLEKGFGDDQKSSEFFVASPSQDAFYGLNQGYSYPSDSTNNAKFNHVKRTVKIRSVSPQGLDSNTQKEILALIEQEDPSDGQLFKKIRELIGITPDEIQEHTKISKEFIFNVEQNIFDQLPPAVYVRGFLRSFLRYLAVPDYEVLVIAYLKRFDDWQKSKK